MDGRTRDVIDLGAIPDTRDGLQDATARGDIAIKRAVVCKQTMSAL